MDISTIFILLGLVCFIASAAAVDYSVRLLPLGLAFYMLALILAQN
jgi:hypothetical protein